MKLVRTVIATVCLVLLAWPSLFADNAPRKQSSGQMEPPSASVEAGSKNTPGNWDVIVLKNGNRIEGWIVKEDDDKALLERRSSRGDRFYTAGINKTEIVRILRLTPEVREAQRQQRRAQEAMEERAASQAEMNTTAPHSYQRATALPSSQAARAASVPAGAARGMYGATPYSTGFGSRYGATGYGVGGYGAGTYGAGGYGAGGFGAGGFGAGGFGAGGFGGGGAVIFSNILQLCQPVNHALVGEVEPVIGLSGQTSTAAGTAFAGR